MLTKSEDYTEYRCTLVSLVNGVSTFVCNLMLKSSLFSTKAIESRIKGVHIFSKGIIILIVSIIVQLEF